MVIDAKFEGVRNISDVIRMFLTYKWLYGMISGIINCSVSLAKMKCSVS